MPHPAPREGYLAVLATPGALPVILLAALGRLTYGTLPLALLLDIRAATGSFAVAGYTLAGFGLATLAMPVKARMIDRLDPPRVLGLLGVATAVPIAVFPYAARHTTTAVLIGLGVAGGLVAVPLGPAMRTLWTHVVPERLVRPALSLDAVVEESLYAIGPVVVAVVVATTSPPVAVVGSAMLVLVGTLGMSWSSRGRWSRLGPPVGSAWSLGALQSRSLLGLLLLVALVATGLGAVDLAVPSRALEQGSGGLAGVLLAMLAVGSAVGGLWWGRRSHRGTLVRQFGVVSVVLALGLTAAAVLTWLPGLMVLLLVTGAAVSPLFIIGYQRVGRVAPPDRLTESMSWINVVNNLGSAAGGALAGAVLDRAGSATVLVLAGSLVAVAALLALVATGRARGDA